MVVHGACTGQDFWGCGEGGGREEGGYEEYELHFDGCPSELMRGNELNWLSFVSMLEPEDRRERVLKYRRPWILDISGNCCCVSGMNASPWSVYLDFTAEVWRSIIDLEHRLQSQNGVDIRDQDERLQLQRSTRAVVPASQNEYLNTSIAYCLAATHISTRGALLCTAIQYVLIYDPYRCP